MVKIAVTGAAGRMGGRIIALAMAEPKRFKLVSAMEAAGHRQSGADAGLAAGAGPAGVAISEALQGQPQVIIDFSTPEGTLTWLAVARQRKIALVVGTTGLTESQLAELADSARLIPIVQAPNMSVGVNLLFKLVGEVAKALGEDYDIEIAETHHRFKKDAPSGTALGLARSICQATGRDMGNALVHGREGLAPRKDGEIGMHALRVGDTVGEHSVHFGNLGETITISHSAHTRDTFVRGALRAAEWLVEKKPGLYSMQDVLFG
jgi:4-hydroxy-tetrahydrodipicolinate reductase